VRICVPFPGAGGQACGCGRDSARGSGVGGEKRDDVDDADDGDEGEVGPHRGETGETGDPAANAEPCDAGANAPLAWFR
jgi:hypothetical protein